jgi:cytochrome c oxidase subunit III
VKLFASLTAKPWEVQGVIADPSDGDGVFLPPAYLGLKVFLAVATVIFSLLVVAYTERMEMGDWHPLGLPWLLWPNTAVLILSSIALHWAVASARRGDGGGLRLGLLAGGALAAVFLAGQLAAWQQLLALGYFVSLNPAYAFFYLITGLHGLHLLGGLVAWARTIGKLRNEHEIARVGASVELCAIYWHFLLAVWLILFGLILFT